MKRFGYEAQNGGQAVPMHVRVRDGRALRERVESVLASVGSHADVARRAGLAPSRLSQLLSESAPVIKVQQAAGLEDVLGVPHGTYFVLHHRDEDAELVAAYLPAEVPEPAEPRDDSADDSADRALSVERESVECGEG